MYATLPRISAQRFVTVKVTLLDFSTKARHESYSAKVRVMWTHQCLGLDGGSQNSRPISNGDEDNSFTEKSRHHSVHYLLGCSCAHSVTSFSTSMPPNPSTNAISSVKEFKTICIAASQEHKIRISDEAIRHLRLTMNTVVASTSFLPEAIDVICAALAERTKRRASLEDVREWLVAPPPADDEGDDDKDLSGEKQHHVRKLWNWKRVKDKTYYLVSWEPTWEPRAYIHASVIAAFEEERRLLVRKKFFEDEAVEDNTLSDTEG